MSSGTNATDASPLKIGFMGVGQMGQCAHLRNYALLSECRVVALAEPRAELARRVSARYGVERVYATGEEMMAAEQLDGVVAAQPFTHHGSLLPPIIERGLPLFIEKPLARSVEVGERLVELARRHGTTLMVGYHKRCDPAVERAMETISRWRETGEAGALRYVRVTMPPGDWTVGGFDERITTDEPPPDTPADPPPEGLGEAWLGIHDKFVNYFIHQVNLLRVLLGKSYEIAYVDPAQTVVVARSEEGAAGVIELAPYSTATDWEETALVGFERGSVRIEIPAPMVLNRAGSLVVRHDPRGASPSRKTPPMPAVHAMKRQAQNFLAVIRGEAEPPCGAVEALEDLRVGRSYIAHLASSG